MTDIIIGRCILPFAFGKKANGGGSKRLFNGLLAIIGVSHEMSFIIRISTDGSVVTYMLGSFAVTIGLFFRSVVGLNTGGIICSSRQPTIGDVEQLFCWLDMRNKAFST